MTIQQLLPEQFNGLMERISMEMSLKFNLLKEIIHGKKGALAVVSKSHLDQEI
jgi:hypothetical protein